MSLEKVGKLQKPKEIPSPEIRKTKDGEQPWIRRIARGVATVEAIMGLGSMVAGAQDLPSQPERAADSLKWTASAQLESTYQEGAENSIRRRDRILKTAQETEAESPKEKPVEKFGGRKEVRDIPKSEAGREARSESMDRKIRDRIEQGQGEVGNREKRGVGSGSSDTQARLESLRKKYNG